MAVEQHLDETIETAIADNRIVGAVLLVSHKGKLVYEKAFGLSDREAGAAMPVNAIFRLSSLTKPIVAATILAMSDAGLLSLDDAVTRFLPDFRPSLPDGSSPEILLRHLITHTSGLDFRPLATPEELRAGRRPWQMGVDAIMATYASRPLLFAPGTSWAYGPSIDVLGAIAGKLIGGTPQDAIARFVLDPLGMTDTRFSVTDPKRLAVPYGDSTDGPQRMGEIHTVSAPWGAAVTYDPGRIFDSAAFQSGGGGMAGTGQDIMRLLEAIRSDGGPILKAETARLGLSNATPQLEFAVAPGWQFSHFGAWLQDPAIASHPGQIGTNRWGGIYGHSWFIDPARALSVVAMTNTGLEGSDGSYRDDITRAVYTALQA